MEGGSLRDAPAREGGGGGGGGGSGEGGGDREYEVEEKEDRGCGDGGGGGERGAYGTKNEEKRRGMEETGHHHGSGQGGRGRACGAACPRLTLCATPSLHLPLPLGLLAFFAHWPFCPFAPLRCCVLLCVFAAVAFFASVPSSLFLLAWFRFRSFLSTLSLLAFSFLAF